MTISVRLNEQDTELIKAYAKMNKITLSELVRNAIMEKYNDDGMLPDYHKVSHGESFLDFMSRPSRPGIYLMDEPEAALSPPPS